MGTIYIIKNKCNDKVYIGQTTQKVQDRWLKHKSDSKRFDNKLYRAIKKYGIDNFFYEIVETDIPRDCLDEREKYWIKYYDSFYNGYNSTFGGQDTRTDFDPSQIVVEWNNGLCEAEIAQKLNLTIDRVSRSLLHQLNISKDEINKRKSLHMQKYNDELLLQYWNSGLTVPQIHNQYGGQTYLLKQRLVNLGIPIEEIEKRTDDFRKYQMKENRIDNERSIYQFDLSGHFIKSYPSMKMAAETLNIDRSSINHCALGDSPSAGGYIWLYENKPEILSNYLKRLKGNKKKVGQYDAHKKLLNEYESIAAAARGVGAKSASTISSLCNRGGGYGYGYYWEFIDDQKNINK